MNGHTISMNSVHGRSMVQCGRMRSREAGRSGKPQFSISRILGSLHDLVDLRARERFEARRQPL
jgi:hypothetical protein